MVLFVVLLIVNLFIFFIKNFLFPLIKKLFDKQVFIFKNLLKKTFSHKFNKNKIKANKSKNRHEIEKLSNNDEIIVPKNKLIDSAKNAFSLRVTSFSETLYFVNTINYILSPNLPTPPKKTVFGRLIACCR